MNPTRWIIEAELDGYRLREPMTLPNGRRTTLLADDEGGLLKLRRAVYDIHVQLAQRGSRPEYR